MSVGTATSADMFGNPFTTTTKTGQRDRSRGNQILTCCTMGSQTVRSSAHQNDTISTMNPRVIVLVVAVAGMAACCLLGAISNMKMVEKVNSRLPKDAQSFPMGWYLSKTLRLHREYKRLFPTGTLLIKVRIATGVGLGCLLGCVWALGSSGSTHSDRLQPNRRSQQR
jgi:hypothetical protein